MLTMNTITRGAAATGVVGLLSLGLVTTAFADDHVPTGEDANHASSWKAYLIEEGYTDVTCRKFEEGFESAKTNEWKSPNDYVLVVLKAGQTNDLFWDVDKGDFVKTVSGQDISHVIACMGEMAEETPTPTPSGSASATSTPSASATSTPSATATPTPSVSASATSTPSATATPTPSVSSSATPTPSTSTSATPTPSVSSSSTMSPLPSGPVVETDVPATSDSTVPVVLGGAAALAGLGLAAGAMRRRGQH